MLKNTPACQFWPIFRYKTVNNSWTKLDIKNRWHFGEKTAERKCPKFQDQGISRSKVKRKRKLWKWTQRNGQFYVQLCTENQRNRATLIAIYTNFANEFFHTVFIRKSVLKGTLRRDQKVIFDKSPISSPIINDDLCFIAEEAEPWLQRNTISATCRAQRCSNETIFTVFPPVQENLFQFLWNLFHLLLLAKRRSLQKLSSIWSKLSEIQLCSQAGTLAAGERNIYQKCMYKEFWQRSFHTQVQMKFVLFESNRRW